MDLTDKVVLITGASSGIGAATARAAADAGARVVPPAGSSWSAAGATRIQRSGISGRLQRRS